MRPVENCAECNKEVLMRSPEALEFNDTKKALRLYFCNDKCLQEWLKKHG